ncbi:MAG TPA: hypothetical protein VML55_11435 [Planctomycetaceae bacterium]|nr:hypothetical protein [Planctomycetaceae bacterium]
MTGNSQHVWLFNIALESQSGEPVAAELAEQLLDEIVSWAEDHQLQIGGGYRPPRSEELAAGPIFVTDESAAPECLSNSAPGVRRVS